MIIDKLHSNYVIKRCREKPHLIQKRLDGIASTILPEALERKLSSILNNDHLLFIRDINVDFEVNPTMMGALTIASIWAEHISSDIKKKIQLMSGFSMEYAEESGVAIFPDKSTYYAYFIRDLIDGVAWDKWYYKGFKVLETVERQAVLKLIFKQAQEISVDILLALEEIGALEKFLQTLTQKGAEEIYLKYLKRSTKSDISTESWEYKNAVSAIRRFIYSSEELKSAKTYKQCLKIYILLMKKYPEYKLVGYSRCIIEDTVFGKREHPGTAEEEIGELKEKEGKIAEKELIGRESLKSFFSLYGGLFLLIPAVLKLRLKEVIEQTNLPADENLSPLNYLLLFLAMMITGKEIDFLEPIDPGIFLFAGLNKKVSVNIFKHYIEGITREMNEDIVRQLLKELEFMKEHSSPYLDYVNLDFNLDIDDFNEVISMMTELILRVFARDLRGFERSSPGYLLANFFERESKVRVERDVIYVDLAKKPLDTVLKLSGLLDYGIKVPWLKNRTIKFNL